jgi:hypothetical protein
VNETPKRAKGWTFNYQLAKELSDDKQMRNLWPWEEIGNVVSVPVVPASHRQHPSQKPHELVDRLVRLSSIANDLILDPFAGSGVVGLSALRYRRQYVLVESHPEYVTATRIAVRHFPRTVRGRLVGRANGLAALSDEELDILTDVPVPQADDLEHVFAVPGHVRSGANTRAQVAKRLTYVPRQGPYYADAAIALGLIRAAGAIHRGGKALEITLPGVRWLSARDSDKPALQREIVLKAPIVKFVAARLGADLKQHSMDSRLLDEQLVAKTLQELDLSPKTAHRRAATLCGWFRRISNHGQEKRRRATSDGRR